MTLPHLPSQWRPSHSSEYVDAQRVSSSDRCVHRVLNILPDPSGPTFLAYTPNGKQLVTAGSNNVVRVYQTGSDEEPKNLDDCQENNTAVAATVGLDGVWQRTNADAKSRTTSFLPALKMAQSACTRWTPTHTRKCSRDVHYQFETLRFRQTVNGLQ